MPSMPLFISATEKLKEHNSGFVWIVLGFGNFR